MVSRQNQGRNPGALEPEALLTSQPQGRRPPISIFREKMCRKNFLSENLLAKLFQLDIIFLCL